MAPITLYENDIPAQFDYREPATGHQWMLWGMDEDMWHSPCVVCGHVFTLDDNDFFQDIDDDRCVCNEPACVTVVMLEEQE